MFREPLGSASVFNSATPAVTVAVPRLVDPSKNSTVPVADASVTSAVKVTESPASIGFAETERAVLVASFSVSITGLLSGLSPMALVARTVNVYGVCKARPKMVQLVPVVVQEPPPGEDETVNSVIGEPPSFAGTSQEISARPDPGVATTEVGASGAPTGVAAFEGNDGVPGPEAVVGVTTNVYGVPLVRPVTTHVVVLALAVEQVAPPGEATTSKPVIPVTSSGASHETVTSLSPATPDTFRGAGGSRIPSVSVAFPLSAPSFAAKVKASLAGVPATASTAASLATSR